MSAVAPATGPVLRRAAERIGVPVAALVISGLLFAVFVALAGADPWGVYEALYRGGFGTWFSWQNTLTRAAPLMLAALATALPARAGLLIIGGEGAVIIGGLAAAAAALAVQGAAVPVVQLVMFAAGALAGGAWIAVAGLLRLYRGVNETISSLLMNYLAISLLLHMVGGPMKDPASLNKPSTAHIGRDVMVGELPGADVHWGFAAGVAVCVMTWLLYRYTTFGFAASVTGGNNRTARAMGLSVGRLLLVTVFIGGAAAGLAGTFEVAAVHGRANESLVAGYGYTGILVAFLARHNPLAIIPVAIFIGGIEAAGGLIQRGFGLPDATVLVLQGTVFLVLLVSETVQGRIGDLIPWRRN